MANPMHVSSAVDIAKESLQVLLDLDTTTDLLWAHATFFKHFIVSALGNLLLVSLYATEKYWPLIRDTFHLALGLVRKLSRRSRPVMRVWKRLKGLEHLQSKLASVHGRFEAEPFKTPEYGEIEESMFFDSDIRDEFAGLFDPNFDLGDFFDGAQSAHDKV